MYYALDVNFYRIFTMIGSIFLLLSISCALLTLIGLIRPSIVMQSDRKKVLMLFFVPAVALMLIGRSLTP